MLARPRTPFGPTLQEATTTRQTTSQKKRRSSPSHHRGVDGRRPFGGSPAKVVQVRGIRKRREDQRVVLHASAGALSSDVHGGRRVRNWRTRRVAPPEETRAAFNVSRRRDARRLGLRRKRGRDARHGRVAHEGRRLVVVLLPSVMLCGSLPGRVLQDIYPAAFPPPRE